MEGAIMTHICPQRSRIANSFQNNICPSRDSNRIGLPTNFDLSSVM
jgi:hypothetical protein